MFKWVEISKKKSGILYEHLSDFLNQKGIKNQVEFIECQPEEFAEALKEAQKKYDGIRLESPYKVKVMEFFTHHSSMLTQIQAADCLIKVHDDWWPRSANFVGLQHTLTTVAKGLDLGGSALVVGAGAGARFSVAALAKLGMKEINITNKTPEDAKKLIEKLKQFYFGVNFNFIPQDQLVLLPGTNSLVINTTPLVKDNKLLEELYYFNFLQRSGIAVDFTVIPLETTFTTEAKDIGIKVIRGYEIAVESDLIWVEWVFGKELDREEYKNSLKSTIGRASGNPTSTDDSSKQS